MGSLTTFPKDRFIDGKHVPADEENVADRMIRARVACHNVADWIDSDEMVSSMGRAKGADPVILTQEELEAKAAAGDGTYGHTAVFEPADVELYKTFMYPPLRMPEKPEVMVSYWDMNDGTVTRFMEGRIMVKALCPDGIESWLVISVPVPNFHTCLEGNRWGWPKYVCDEMTVERDHSECIYEGKPSLTMDFTPHDFDEATIKQLEERGTEGGNTISFHMSIHSAGLPTLMRQGSGHKSKDEDGTYYAEWEAGMVKIWGRPEDKWSRLVPENCEVPGAWMRRIRTGANAGGGMRKISE